MQPLTALVKQVCGNSHVSVDPASCTLMHGKKVLQLDDPIRFAALPRNAVLTMTSSAPCPPFAHQVNLFHVSVVCALVATIGELGLGKGRRHGSSWGSLWHHQANLAKHELHSGQACMPKLGFTDPIVKPPTGPLEPIMEQATAPEGTTTVTDAQRAPTFEMTSPITLTSACVATSSNVGSLATPGQAPGLIATPCAQVASSTNQPGKRSSLAVLGHVPSTSSIAAALRTEQVSISSEGKSEPQQGQGHGLGRLQPPTEADFVTKARTRSDSRATCIGKLATCCEWWILMNMNMNMPE
jgi:hypothetical protein